jgi:two-component system sensor histidine kinase HydH
VVRALHLVPAVKTNANIAKFGRWALLAATVAMGVALLLTVFWTYRGVNTATVLLLRGQADLLNDGVRARLRGEAPETVDLREVLDGLADDGLLYVALVSPVDGKLLGEAGTPVGGRVVDLAEARERSGEPVEIEGRARMVSRGWQGRRRPSAERPATPRPAVVIEFDPQAARELRAAARSTFAVGLVGAGAFLMLALGLVRWLLRRESTERKLEHERRLAALGSMSATLAHEIRNPLASLKGNAQLLERALPAGEKPRAKAELVVAEAVRLETLVNDLLEFARAGEVHRVDSDPAALAREVAVSLDPSRVEIDSTAAPARWRLDPDRLRQVLANLVENALQASDGPVSVRIAAEGGKLAFVVRDQGPGVPPEDLDKIFEPFFTRRTRGTGLGLPVARRIVELHGGTLAAENAATGGAVFTVSLPR